MSVNLNNYDQFGFQPKKTSLHELAQSTRKEFANFEYLLKYFPDQEMGSLIKPHAWWKGRNCIVYALIHDEVGHAEAIFERLTEEQKKDLINEKDSSGFTVTDYAAIFAKDSFYRQLIKIPGATVTKGPYFNTPKFLRKVLEISKNILLDKDCRIYFQKPGNKVDSLITGEELVRNYRHLFSIPPEHFGTLFYMDVKAFNTYWLNRKIDDSQSQNDQLQKFFESINTKKKTQEAIEPNLAIRLLEMDDQGNSLKNLGCTLFVRQDPFEAGDLITLYGGEIVEYDESYSLNKESSSYCLTLGIKGGVDFVVDAAHVRSLGSLPSHGFPNANLTVVNGLPALRAIEKINPGQPVVASYGLNYFHYPEAIVSEIRPAAIIQFIRCNSLKDFPILVLEEKHLTDERRWILYKWTYLIKEEPIRFLQLILRRDFLKVDLDFATILLDEFENNVTPTEQQTAFANLAPFVKSFHSRIPKKAGHVCLELAERFPHFAKELAAEFKYSMYSTRSFKAIVKRFAAKRADITDVQLDEILKKMD